VLRHLPAAKLPQAELTVSSRAGAAIPRSFLGISTEYWTLPIWERHPAVLERVLANLHASGDGPLSLRIGGDSADLAYWDPTGLAAPEWAFGLTPNWLAEVGQLVRQTGLRLILDLNLVTATPTIAAEWARAATTEFPPHGIAGFEIGNEPDLYSRSDWRTLLAASAVGRGMLAPTLAGRGILSATTAGVLPRKITARTYARAFVSYERAIGRVAPDTPLLGPAVSDPFLSRRWISKLLSSRHPRLGEITGHRYAYTACAATGSVWYPTVARLLSEGATTRMAQAQRPAVALAHRARLPFRLTELNSVTCGGRRGVSDTFASALWAPDALFELLRVNVDGVNVHVREYPINGAFAFYQRGLLARPLLYGLVTFARTVGRGAKVVPVHLRAQRSLRLKAWAVRVHGPALHVLVIDKGNRPVRLSLHLTAAGPATVQRLLAPSVNARSGVTLAGQRLDRTGEWRGVPAAERLRRGVHGYQLTLPRYSAALLAVSCSTRASSATRRTGRRRRPSARSSAFRSASC
jgi:hypothetical protein